MDDRSGAGFLDVGMYVAAAGVEPDMALLQRVAAALGGGGENPAVAALKARIEAIVAAANETGALDETMMAELPAEIAEQLRAAWLAQQDAGIDNA